MSSPVDVKSMYSISLTYTLVKFMVLHLLILIASFTPYMANVRYLYYNSFRGYWYLGHWGPLHRHLSSYPVLLVTLQGGHVLRFPFAITFKVVLTLRSNTVPTPSILMCHVLRGAYVHCSLESKFRSRRALIRSQSNVL